MTILRRSNKIGSKFLQNEDPGEHLSVEGDEGKFRENIGQFTPYFDL